MHNNYRYYYPHKYPHPPPLPHKNQACLSYKDNFLLMFIIIDMPEIPRARLV